MIIIILTLLALFFIINRMNVKSKMDNDNYKSEHYSNCNNNSVCEDLIKNDPSPQKNAMYNELENQFYHLKDDCIFNTSCILKPNNYSFFHYKRPNKKPNVLLNCTSNLGSNTLENCSNFDQLGCFENKECPCNSPNLKQNVGVLEN